MGDKRTGSVALAEKITRSYLRRTRLWYVATMAATLGALVYAVASWMPWVLAHSEVAIVGQGGQPQFAMYTLRLTPGDVEGRYGALVAGAATVAPLLLVPLLWMVRRSINNLFALLVFIIGTCSADMAILRTPLTGSLHLTDGLRPNLLAVTDSQRLAASWVALAALATVNVAGIVLLLHGVQPQNRDRRDHRDDSLTALRRANLPGAGAFTLGLLLLLASVFLVGWAGDNCTATPLLASTCTGLSFSDVAYYGILTRTDLFDPIASLHAIPLLLAGGAALILLALWWRRRVTPGLCLWITLYLATATFSCVVALAGVGAVSDHAAALGLQAGTWRGQTGAYVAAAGLLVAWLALVSLWYAALRHGDAASATP